jgi:hypothetical protein
MFWLNKWYLDVVDDKGNSVILYWARLDWGPFGFSYGASIFVSHSKEPAHRHTLRPGKMPDMSSDVTEWSCDALNLSGIWVNRAARFGCALIEGPRGFIHWDCVSPVAQAEVCIDGQTIKGLGYAEHITMTLKPWQLPFRELSWGRFLSPSNTLIWIQWRDPVSRTWVWLNGVEQQSAIVTEDRVELADEGTVLNLEKDKVIRSGYVNTNSFRSLRALGALMPGWRSLHETKWLARVALERPDRNEYGWLLHEVVRWP